MTSSTNSRDGTLGTLGTLETLMSSSCRAAVVDRDVTGCADVDVDDTNDNDEGDSTPRADACAQCTDKVSNGMARRGIACTDIDPADLGKRCLRYQRWFDQGWKDWDLCRKTCSDAG